MSEILVHAFGDATCEIHVSKHTHPDDETLTAYVTSAFICEGSDAKRAIANAQGVALHTIGANRQDAIAEMIQHLQRQFDHALTDRSHARHA